MRLETRAVHAGTAIDPATGAVTPPIQLSVTFERDADGGYPRGFLYGRNSNPNREELERCLADLEGGEAAAAFASGTAAIMAVAQALSPGDHLIAPTDIIEHRASIEQPGTRTPQNLLRLSVGLEHPDNLVDDLAQALA